MVLPEGTRVILRRKKVPQVIEQNDSTPPIALFTKPKPFSFTNQSFLHDVKPQKQIGMKQLAVSMKKLRAQASWYRRNGMVNEAEKLPVHQRLGTKERMKQQLFYHPNQRFIKPRIRKTKEGLITKNYAQKRIKRLRESFRVEILNNGKVRTGPQLSHSVQYSCNPKLQETIKTVQCGKHTEHDIPNIPMVNGGCTNIPLHVRFNQYP